MTAKLDAKCVRCGCSLADGATICRREALELTEALTVAAGHIEDAEAVIARQTRYGAGARSSGDKGLEPNLAASTRLAAADNAITTWLRILVEEGYAPIWPSSWHPVEGPLCPPVRPGDEERERFRCDHDSCFAIRGRTPPPPAARRCARLAELVVTELRFHPAAAEAFSELQDACAQLARLVDRPPDKELVGRCDCGARLYAHKDQTYVKCAQPTCGLKWNTDESRKILLAATRDQLFTAYECARWAAFWTDRTTEQIRKLIASWTRNDARRRLDARGWIPNPDYSGADDDPTGWPTYLLGEVLDLLAQTPRRQRKREAA